MKTLAILLLTALPATTSAATPGLMATLSDGTRTVRMVMPGARFSLAAGESIHPALQPRFDAEWTGNLTVLQAGAYSFTTGGARIWIDNASVAEGPLTLGTGRHAIRVTYRRPPGPATLQLRWRSDRFSEEPVPLSVLSHEGAISDTTEQGRDLVDDLGCRNCHADRASGRAAIELTAIGARMEQGWIERRLENPGQSMPDLLNREEQIDVAAYLASLKGADPSPKFKKPGPTDVGRGAELFGSIGCSACHSTAAGLGLRMKAPAVPGFLLAKHTPSMMLTNEEAFSLTAFLTENATSIASAGGNPEQGRVLLTGRGCLACHAMQPPSTNRTGPRFAMLPPGKPCTVARYRLTPEQQSAIAAYQQRPDITPAPVHEFYRTVRRMRCNACHRIDHLEPTAITAEAVPDLTGAGGKLKTGWIQEVLTGKQRVHRALTIRMPHYRPDDVRGLAEGFAKAAGVEPGEGIASPQFTELQRARGHGMLGTSGKTGGMACIGCHDWGANRSLGEEGPQLINVTRRLRYEWYQRWMRNPARILSGTSMPSYFTSMEPRRAEETIATLWAAMSLGDRMPLPEGFSGTPAADAEAHPTPGKEAIVVRWDMPEATPAAIAVGLPGGLSYCFDAGESRLRYAWRGGFIDLSGTLLKKTGENRLTPTAKIVGEMFYKSAGFPFRAGDSRMPEHRFKGYRFVSGFPEFHYLIDGMDVYEQIVPAGAGIARKFRLSRVDRPLWFEGREIAPGRDVRFEVLVQ